MKINKKKKTIYMIINVILIGLLISASSTKTVNTVALQEEEEFQKIITFSDKSSSKLNDAELDSTEKTSVSMNPSIVVDSAGNIHIAWHDETDHKFTGDGLYDIFYKRWNSTSFTWTITELISTENNRASEYPSLAVDSVDNVHIVWQDKENYIDCGYDYDIFYKHWNASTESWSTTEVISTKSTEDSFFPSIAVDSAGNVHVAWDDGTDYSGSGVDKDIFYKRWNSTSSTWSITEVISVDNANYSLFSSIAVDSAGNVHVAWDEFIYGSEYLEDPNVFYKHWNASTESWSTTELVSTESSTYSYYNSLAVDYVGNVHIAWQDWTDYNGAGIDWDIFYKHWNASSESWSTTEVISTESTESSSTPSLSIGSSGNVHIAWEDWTEYAGVDGDIGSIFYKNWDASSESWSTTDVISTESTEFAGRPSLIVDYADNVHVAWSDYTDYSFCGTDLDIFYKRWDTLSSSWTSTEVVSTESCYPITPILAYIFPNPSTTGIINLDWNDQLGRENYYVYRSTSFIWSTEGLSPLAIVTSSNFSDTLTTKGYFFYVIMVEHFTGNTSLSNCEYVEYKISSPELSIILPNPTESNTIYLDWNDVLGATTYYVYRSSTYIWSVESLTSIATVSSSEFIDTLPTEGSYFYAIVASDGSIDSSHSNCQYVKYIIPTLNEFTLAISIVVGITVIFIVTASLRRKRS